MMLGTTNIKFKNLECTELGLKVWDLHSSAILCRVGW